MRGEQLRPRTYQQDRRPFLSQPTWQMAPDLFARCRVQAAMQCNHGFEGWTAKLTFIAAARCCVASRLRLVILGVPCAGYELASRTSSSYAVHTEPERVSGYLCRQRDSRRAHAASFGPWRFGRGSLALKHLGLPPKMRKDMPVYAYTSPSAASPPTSRLLSEAR